MRKGLQSYLHVTIQFASLLYLMLSGPAFPNNYLVLPEFIGILIGLWAVWTMRSSVLSVFPNPNKGSVLIETGPYKLIRHPMYLALFLVTIPLIIYYSTPLRLIVFFIFSVNQIIKMYFEEKLLKNSFLEYKEYMERTSRLLPFLY